MANALPSKMEGYGSFVYGLIRAIRPHHGFAEVSTHDGRELVMYAATGFKDNKQGGMSVVDHFAPHEFPDDIKAAGLSMRLLPVAPGYEIPEQYDLDFLITDDLEMMATYRDRVRPGGYILGPIAALDEYGGVQILSMMLWRR